MKRVVLITGASRGIGRGAALRFAAGGDFVIVNYSRDREGALSTLGEVRKKGPGGEIVKCDVSKSADVEEMFGWIKERFGMIDVLINNAGIKREAPLIKMGEKDFDDVIAVNLKGPFLCAKAAGKIMSARKSGHVINVSSILGVRGAAGEANYAAAKAGLIAFAKSAARELGRFNVSVNVVLPGLIMTEMGKSNPDWYIEKATSENCLGRLSDLEEVSDFIYELSMKKNISGQVFNLDSRII